MAVSEGELARRITALRHARGMTQADLAAAAHISRETVSAIEAARPASVRTVLRVAEALGATVAALLGDEQPRLPPPRPGRPVP
jgi:transcriptional regulator with XRE-family HTH domain